MCFASNASTTIKWAFCIYIAADIIMLFLSYALRKFRLAKYLKFAYTAWLLLVCVSCLMWGYHGSQGAELDNTSSFLIYFGMQYVMATVRFAIVLLSQSMNTVTSVIVTVAYIVYSICMLKNTV